MNEHDFEPFADAFGAAWDFHKPLSDRAMAAAFAQLSAYPLQVVLSAINAHMLDPRRGQYAPKPADIVAQIEAGSPRLNRLSADEAWAMMPSSEEDSIVWTDEMAQAFAIASPLLADGDRIGARMAFKGAYERLSEQNRALGKPVTWTVSRGWNADNLESVVKDAVRLGRLSPEKGREHVSSLEYKQNPGIAMLVNQASEGSNKEHALAFVAKVKAMLVPDESALNAAREEAQRHCEEADRLLAKERNVQKSHG